MSFPALPYYPSKSPEYAHIRYRTKVHKLGLHQVVLAAKKWKLMNWDKTENSWTKYNQKPEVKEKKATNYQTNKININNKKKEYKINNLIKVQEQKHLYYVRNRSKIRQSTKKYYQAWKNYNKYLVVFHYTNGKMCCQNCYMDVPELLTIDHIEGGGNKHRKYLGSKNLYVWLRRNDFPIGYQILCYNCNMIKHRVSKERYDEISQKLRGWKLFTTSLIRGDET